MASHMAALTGDSARVEKYGKLRQEIAEAFNRELWVADKGLYRDGTTIADQYARLGITLRVANIDRVNAWAEIMTRFGDVDAGIRPTLFIHQRCGRLTHLRQVAYKAGVKRVVICTPPVSDAKGDATKKFGDENLTRYTTWLLSKRADGWDVVDLHTPMRRALDKGRAKDPAFMFAKDDVHPDRKGHWLMAREIIKQYFGADVDGPASAEELYQFPLTIGNVR